MVLQSEMEMVMQMEKLMEIWLASSLVKLMGASSEMLMEAPIKTHLV